MDKFKNFIEFLIFVLKGIVYIFENFGFFILEGLFGKNVKGINIDVGGVIKNKQMIEEEFINDIQKQVLGFIKEYGIEGKVFVIQEERGLLILFKDVLFDIGFVKFIFQVKEVVYEIVKILEKVLNNNIRIEGYIDNVFIYNKYFYFNWEFLIVRVIFVLQEILRVLKVRFERFFVVGYGEYRLIVFNKILEGRVFNRRVIIVILRMVYSKVEFVR